MGREQATAAAGLRRVLEPDSVAVVGASRETGKRGHRIMEALDRWDFDGGVYPVNPKYAGGTILGYDVYGAVTDVPGPVDLACVMTPASIVPDVLEDCGRAGVAGAVVVAAGFGEVGNDDLQERALAVAREHGVRLIGPNTNGLINVHHRLDLLDRPDIPPGNVALVSQSGNLASGFVNEAIADDREGFSFYLSVGNEADVTFDEYLAFLAGHDETDAAMCYVEGMADGRAFLREAARVTTEMPVVALKGGLSDAGKQSAASHTASIAGSGAVINDVYRQAGVVRVERADELLSVSDALANLPPAGGPNVAILSDGGGHATHAADSLTEHGLEIPAFGEETRARIEGRVPDQAPNVVNPVDVLTLEHDMDIYADCAEAILDDPAVDALLLCGYFGGYASSWDGGDDAREVRVAERIAELVEAHGKPVVAQTMFADDDAPAVDVLEDSPVPVFGSINTATRCLAALSTYGDHRLTAAQKSNFVASAPDPSAVVTDAAAAGHDRLTEQEARTLLAEYGAPVAPAELVTTADEAVAAAAGFDGPVAMKVLSRDVVHKSDAGGVALDVEGAADVRAAYGELVDSVAAAVPAAAVEGVLVSPMADDGVEVIVGVTRDEEVGPVVMFGLGGVFVEVLEDVAFRGVPLTEYDAREMIDELDGSAVLRGTRGEPGVDEDALVDLLTTVSEVACDHPRLAELDVNPAIATPDGVEIVDAAAVLDADGNADDGD